MSFVQDHLLSSIVFLPLIAACIALAFPRGEHTGVRGFALAATLVDFALSLWLWMRFDPKNTSMQLVESVNWVPSLGIHYGVGVDGLAILLIVLTTFLAPIVVLSTYSSVTERSREYTVCLLLLQTGMLGAFVATDLFLFYVFWEAMLIPMYFLIGVWGGRRRIYAALKFFLYTMAGSLLMLVAIIYCVWAVKDQGGLTFDSAEIAERITRVHLGGAEVWLFLAFALAFAIKVPMFPFHTWLPDAHVEAPTGGSVILAGVLLKLGTFGFLRYALWLFPSAAVTFLPAIGILAVIGIIYGALVAMVQSDLKRLVAYSSVSHLGFVMLGIAGMTVTGVSGGVLQMVNHGISTGALFLLVGVIYERRHTRELDDFGGIAKAMPMFAAVFVFIALSSIGLPGLNGFVGEFLILMGTFQSEGVVLRATTGEVAWVGICAAQLAALTGVLLVVFKLARLAQKGEVGRFTQVFASVLATFAAAALVAPPLGSYGGGVLIRPLLSLTSDTSKFKEIFAVLGVVAASGVIFAAVYMLWAVQRVFFGPIKHSENEHLRDLSLRESLVLAPLVVLALVMGVYPQPFLDTINPSMAHYAQEFRARAGMPPLPGTAPRSAMLGLPSLPGAHDPTVVPVDPAQGDAQQALPWRQAVSGAPAVEVRR